MERIYVAVRVRPPTKQEPVKGNYWRIEDNQISLRNALGTPISGYSYAFDHVFGYDSKNSNIYDVHTKDVIEAAVHGFNGTVFAYGQTSSGKTYTMQGSSEDPGIIRLAVYNVFQNIELITDREFLIRVSYMEIYNEEINDLLAPENRKLQVHENLERGIFVAGLREEIVNSPGQVFELVELGEAHRHVGETNMNVRSSRSHTIFRMVIESRDKDAEANVSSYDKDAVRVSVLNLVDLAGSERVAKTGAGGVRLKEGTHINKSLMSLGTVINKLSEAGGKQRGHVPYRDSKLTRILQPALGGNAKTAIICTVAPEEIHTDETRGTLQFASRAKRVTNCAKVNEIMTDAALLKRQKREIEELRNKLQGSHSEVLEQEILKLRNDMLKFELEREKLAMELEEERKAQLERDRRIMEQQQKIENLSTLVINSDPDRNSYRLNNSDHSYSRRLSLESFDQERRSTGNGCREGSLDSRVTLRSEKLQSPLKTLSIGSTEKPRSCSKLTDGSPIPSNFGNIADEDLWMSMNKGHATTELDFLQNTPNGKCSSVPSNTPYLNIVEGYQNEIKNLKQQLENAHKEKNEVQRCLEDQLMLNDELKSIVCNLESEAALIGEILQKLCEAILDSKTDQKGISLYLQALFPQETSGDDTHISTTDKGKQNMFSILKENYMKFADVFDCYKKENMELRQECNMLHKQLNHAVASLVLNTDNCIDLESKSLQNDARALTEIADSEYSHITTSLPWVVNTSSNISCAPFTDNFKQICHNVCKLDSLGAIPAVNLNALCAEVAYRPFESSANGSLDSRPVLDFILALKCTEFDKQEGGDGCGDSDMRESMNMNSQLANVMFLAKWLVEDLKILLYNVRCFWPSSLPINSAIGKLLEGLKVFLSEVVKLACDLCLSSVEEDNSSTNFKVDMMCHWNINKLQKGLAICGEINEVEEQKFQSEELNNLYERLNMSAEHILSLDNKVALLNMEKDAISKALDNELSRQEQKQFDTRFRELLIDELEQLSSAIATRDAMFGSIISSIREFEDNMENKRSLSWVL